VPRKKKPTDINSVREKYETAIMQIPGVTGIGIGDNGPAGTLVIKIYVERLTPALREQLPKELEGFLVVSEETGEFGAL
jgi:hypothetical protein